MEHDPELEITMKSCVICNFKNIRVVAFRILDHLYLFFELNEGFRELLCIVYVSSTLLVLNSPAELNSTILPGAIGGLFHVASSPLRTLNSKVPGLSPAHHEMLKFVHLCIHSTRKI